MEYRYSYKVSSATANFILCVLSLSLLVMYIDRTLFSIAVQPIKSAFNLSDAQMGFLQAIFILGITLLTIPGAILIERWNRHISLGIMAIIWSIATFCIGLSNDFAQMAIALFFMGAGEAAYISGGTGWLSLAFVKEKRARVISIFTLGMPLGIVIGSILGGILILQLHDWRMAFFIFAIPGIVLGIFTFFLRDYATIKEAGEAALNRSYLAEVVKVFQIKTFCLHVIATTLFYFFFFSFIFWFPALIMRAYSMNTLQAGLLVGLMDLTCLIATPLGGFLADFWQKRKENGRALFLAFTVLTTSVLIAIMLWIAGQSLSIFIPVATLSMFVGFMIPGVLFTMVSDVTPARLRTSSYALAVIISFLLGAILGPIFTGAISDSLGGAALALKSALLLTVITSFIAAIVWFIMAKYYSFDSRNIGTEIYSEN